MQDKEPPEVSEFFSNWQNAVMDQPEEKIIPDFVRTSQYLEQEKKAAIDPLTGLKTRRALDDRMRQLIKTGARNIGFLLIDGNDFGQINKKLSYAYGDNYIQRTALMLRSQTDQKKSDEYRLGGDELVVIASVTSQEQLDGIGQRITNLYSGGNEQGGAVIPTVSVGGMFIGADADNEQLKGALKAVDAAMKEAKERAKQQEPVTTIFHQQNANIPLRFSPSSYVRYQEAVHGPLAALPDPKY
jgi:diguanylate cyclase (GGDEF)-like protein